MQKKTTKKSLDPQRSESASSQNENQKKTSRATTKAKTTGSTADKGKRTTAKKPAAENKTKAAKLSRTTFDKGAKKNSQYTRYSEDQYSEAANLDADEAVYNKGRNTEDVHGGYGRETLSRAQQGPQGYGQYGDVEPLNEGYEESYESEQRGYPQGYRGEGDRDYEYYERNRQQGHPHYSEEYQRRRASYNDQRPFYNQPRTGREEGWTNVGNYGQRDLSRGRGRYPEYDDRPGNRQNREYDERWQGNPGYSEDYRRSWPEDFRSYREDSARGWQGGYERSGEGRHGEQEDRGFFERVGDKIRDTWHEWSHRDEPGYREEGRQFYERERRRRR